MRVSASSWTFNSGISGDVSFRSRLRGRWEISLNGFKVLHIEQVPGKFYLCWRNPNQGVQQLKNFIDRFLELTKMERYEAEVSENAVLIKDLPNKKVHSLTLNGPVIELGMPMSALFHMYTNSDQDFYSGDSLRFFRDPLRNRDPQTWFQ